MNESAAMYGWAFAIFFVVLWLLIFFIIARWGGWRRLYEAYPAVGGTPMGDRYRMRSAELRAGCNYNNCITFTSSQMGLYLAMPLPFRFQHPPIFLPWGEVQVHEERAWLVPVVVLTALRCPEIPIKLHRRLAERLLSRSGSPLDGGRTIG